MSRASYVPTEDHSSFARAMGPVALALLGEPAERLQSGQEWRYGKHGSLSVRVDKGTWYDNEAGEGGGTLDLIRRKIDGDKLAALEWMRERSLLESDRAAPAGRQIVATYDYRDDSGALLFQVVRFEPKKFRQRRPDGRGGWDWTTSGIKRVLYRLPELIAAARNDGTVYIVEGEKGANALAAIGLTATCSPCGAGKWKSEYSSALAGANVVILPDDDEPGRKHADQVAAALQGVAEQVRILPLPDLPPKGDVADWIAAGGTAEQLEALAARAEEVKALPVLVESPAYLADESGIVTEDSVALAFARHYSDTLRYCHTAGAWYRWNGSIWRKDNTKVAFAWARATARRIAKKSGNDNAIRAAGKASFCAGVERFAQSDTPFAVTGSMWDIDPWLLGTPEGTVDLKTGKLREANPGDHITKTTAVSPSKKEDCSRWLAFLEEASGGDHELVAFLKRWLGYTLTGITTEHALLFVYGDGGNGKGVCMNTFAGIMDEYAVNAPMDTFTASKGDKHPTDMAMLAGARMVMTTEVEEGQTWAEGRLKNLTGGDPVTARFMNRDYFTYHPQFKLTISGNHKPALRNIDAAARRRFNLAPFINKPAVPNTNLFEALKKEWPGILRWAINGCLEWQKSGLNQPAAVKLATEDYFEEQDCIADWMDECCIVGRDAADTIGNLFASWRAYASRRADGERDARWLSGTLERHGLRKVRDCARFRGRGFLGIEVKPPPAVKHWQETGE